MKTLCFIFFIFSSVSGLSQIWTPIKNSDIEISTFYLDQIEIVIYKKDSIAIAVNKKFEHDFTKLFLGSKSTFQIISDSCGNIDPIFISDTVENELNTYGIKYITVITNRKVSKENKKIEYWNLTSANGGGPYTCYPILKIEKINQNKLRLIKTDRGACEL